MIRIEDAKPINTKARNRREAVAVVSPTQLGRAIALALSTFFSGQALGAGEGKAQALSLADAGTNGHYRLIRLLEVGAIRASQALISDSAAASDRPAQNLHLASVGQVPPEIAATPATPATG